MIIRLSVAAFLLLSLAHLCRAELNAVSDLHCRPDDPAFDNGAVLTAAIRAGRVNDTVHFPGGAYYATTTVDDCGKEGLAFEGQGMTVWRAAGAYKPGGVGGASVRWVYNGPADKPAWRLAGTGVRMTGINIFRGWYTKSPTWDGSVAIQGTWIPDGPPSGKWHISDCCLAGFETAIHFELSNHVDNIIFDHVTAQGCRRVLDSENNQTSGVEFRHLVAVGPGEVVFDIASGGNFFCTSLQVLNKRLIWRFRGTGSNTCSYTVENLKVDNNAAGWRLVEMLKPGPLNLTVRGHVGKKARPADEAIVLKRPARNVAASDYTHVDVELWHNGRLWPAEIDSK
jgi:hypothetical protein